MNVAMIQDKNAALNKPRQYSSRAAHIYSGVALIFIKVSSQTIAVKTRVAFAEATETVDSVLKPDAAEVKIVTYSCINPAHDSELKEQHVGNKTGRWSQLYLYLFLAENYL